MQNKNFLNIHVLISHSPSCLNRDDMNMQKSAVFGGVRRVRVSSQSLKRAMRKSAYYEDTLGKPSDRTRQLGLLKDKYIKTLEGKYSPELVSLVIRLISGKEDIPEGTQADAVASWSVAEIEKLCELAQNANEKELDEKKFEKIMKEAAKPLLSAMAKSMDIALSGRMATSGLMTSIDGAMSVAHSITTHAVDADIDWFTAVDDLVPLGSGHLDTQEFSSGVFYRYASVNLDQLSKNMGDAGREKALEVSAHLLHLLATVVPSAKQKTFAAYNPADFVMVSFGDMPVSAANAFEEPVEFERPGGYLKASIKKFDDYITRVYSGYGFDDKKAVFSLWDTTLAPKKDKLDGLKEWVRNDGK